MCGLAGFFLGCTHRCRALRPCHLEGEYRSPFGGWREKAALFVDASVVPTATPIRDGYFSPSLVPVLAHPLVSEMPDERQSTLLRLYLLRYLSFTIRLETLVVNDVLARIINGEGRELLTRESLLDAYKIYVDEAYHAMMCTHAIARVQPEASKNLPLYTEFPFIARHRELSRADCDQTTIVRHVFVIVSELLITQTLASVKNTQGGINHSIKDVIRMHAADEGRHHSYFAQYLTQMWKSSSHDMRAQIAGLIPDAISAFLTPDLANMRAELEFLGLDRDAAQQVLDETYRPGMIREQKKHSARAILQYMTYLEIDQLPDVRDKLLLHELA